MNGGYAIIFSIIVGCVISSVVKSIVVGLVARKQIEAGQHIEFVL